MTGTTSGTLDTSTLRAKAQATWAAGEYAAVAAQLVFTAERLCEAADLRAGSRVLDVAAGTGNAALAAARMRCDVVALDFVPALLSRASLRAEAEGLHLELVEGDAAELPFPDGSFDAVLSVFGVMFAPDQARAASGLLRVCRPGGTIALASWDPQGTIGDLFALIRRYAPPGPDADSPLLWGTRKRLEELFGDGVSELRTVRKSQTFRFRSPDEYADFYLDKFGPLVAVSAGLDEKRRGALRDDLLALVGEHVTSSGTVRAQGEYLEAVATRS
jgi:SAM-dependent methyltransferase